MEEYKLLHIVSFLASSLAITRCVELQWLLHILKHAHFSVRGDKIISRILNTENFTPNHSLIFLLLL
jgi:hypothetical protein